MLITYIKGGTPAQFFLERGSAMTRATFVIFWPKLSSFIDWCCYYTQVSYTGCWEPLVSFNTICTLKKIWIVQKTDNAVHLINLWRELLSEWKYRRLLYWVRCRTPLQKKLGKGSPFNVSYQHCCKNNIIVNDSQNLAFATSHFVIELLPFDYLSINQKQWNSTK
jgi:hypothetical protein